MSFSNHVVIADRIVWDMSVNKVSYFVYVDAPLRIQDTPCKPSESATGLLRHAYKFARSCINTTGGKLNPTRKTCSAPAPYLTNHNIGACPLDPCQATLGC